MNIADTVCYITNFLNLISLSRANKFIYQAIITDIRYIFIKTMYILCRRSQAYLIRIKLLQTSKYNFNKLAPCYLLEKNDDARESYIQIQNDTLITFPKYYNPIYSNDYFYFKFKYECILYRSYQIQVKNLINYYKQNETNSILHDTLKQLPVDYLLGAKDTEFAEKCILLLEFNLYVGRIRFIYDGLPGVHSIMINTFADWVDLFINKIKLVVNRYQPDFCDDIAKFLKMQLNITDREAVIFLRYIIAVLNTLNNIPVPMPKLLN